VLATVGMRWKSGNLICGAGESLGVQERLPLALGGPTRGRAKCRKFFLLAMVLRHPLHGIFTYGLA